MIVRCGACRSQFEVQGPGRYPCPACGSVNAVRAAAGGPAAGPPPGYTAPPPPRPEPPSPRMTCPECDFSFIVGKIAVATCPNCGAEVETGWTDEES